MMVKKRWLVLAAALILILAAGNLFLCGALLGRQTLVRNRPADELAVARFLQTVPPGARPAIRKVLAYHRQELRSRIGELLEDRRRMSELLRQPDLDEAAVQAALADVRASTTRLQQLVHELLFLVARDLPPEVRATWQKRWTDGLLPGKLP